MAEELSFARIDRLLIFFYFATIVGLGLFFNKVKSKEEDFLIAGRKLSIGFKKPKIEGVLSLGDVSSDIYGGLEGWAKEEMFGYSERYEPVWGFSLKFRW